MSNLSDILDNYQTNPDQYINQLREALTFEITEVMKRQRASEYVRQSKYKSYTFILIYKEGEELPIKVKWNDYEELFDDAFVAVFLQLLKKIDEAYFAENKRSNVYKTVQAMKGEEKDRKRWIKSTLGMVLHNKVFYDRIYPKVSLFGDLNQGIHYNFKKINIENELADDLKKDGDVLHIQPQGSILKSPDVYKKTNYNSTGANFENALKENTVDQNDNLEKKKKALQKKDFSWSIWDINQKINYNTEEVNFENVLMDKFVDPEDIREVLSMQKEAFFWTPLIKIYQGKVLEVKKRLVTIIYFYYWLRVRLSGAKPKNFAKEVEVDVTNACWSNVKQYWLPDPNLLQPFTKTIPTCPVFFENDAICRAGLLNQTIRNYNKKKEKEYQEDSKEYMPVKIRKEILWQIYNDELTNAHLIEYFNSEFLDLDEKIKPIKRDKYTFEIKINENPGVYITSIEVNDA